jgi:hypothetical protein
VENVGLCINGEKKLGFDVADGASLCGDFIHNRR